MKSVSFKGDHRRWKEKLKTEAPNGKPIISGEISTQLC
jgi:hypothetical protein